MSPDLGTLTSDKGLSPLAKISVDGRPYIALDDHLLSGSNSGKAEVMRGVKMASRSHGGA